MARLIRTISPSRWTVRSSTSGSTARPWIDGSSAASTNSRREGMPLGGPSAVTTFRVSPTTGSGMLMMRVAPATGAFRVAGPPAASRLTRTIAGCDCGPGPKETVQVFSCQATKTGASGSASMRRAAWSAPLNACTPRRGRTLGVAETSRVAGASNTTQMASPRRNTAAPAGLAQVKASWVWPPATLASIRTTPPGGRGLGRGGSASATATASGSAAGSTGGASAFSKTLT